MAAYDTHLWVAAAAASLTLFAAVAVGATGELPSMGVVFSATLLIYAVDDAFDGRMGAQPARWPLVALGVISLSAQLLLAPAAVVLAVTIGALPALLYGASIRGRRLRQLPGVKPFFVAASVAVAVVAVPALWSWSATQQQPAVPRVLATTAVLFLLVLSNVCLFDLRDRVADARSGLRTIPVRLGVAGTTCLSANGGRLEFALIVDGVPVLHGLTLLLY